MITIPTYNQGDPLWGSKLLGTSGLTMARYGCYVTSASMILDNYGLKITPGQLCDQLNANNGFFDGQLSWSAVQQLYPDELFYKSAWTTAFDKENDVMKETVESAIERIKRLVRWGIPVLGCVDLVGHDGIPDHAIVIYDAPDDLTKWRVKDPDGGRDDFFQTRYGSPLTGLKGYRVLLGPPVTFPDYSTATDGNIGQALWKASQVYQGRMVKTYAKEILDSLI